MRIVSSLFILIIFLGSASLANADYDLLQKNNCFACHGIDKRKYGPKFIDVAAKYANDSNAEESLAQKIRAGGTGIWGEDVMPPQAHVTEEDALMLAKYILSLSESKQ